VSGMQLNSYYCNVQSITNKLAEFEVLASSAVSFDMFAFSETWLGSDFSNAIFPPDIKNRFAIYRCDRIGRKGGGVALFVKNSMNSVEIALPKFELIEVLLVKLVSNTSLYICVLYRSPGFDKASLQEVKQLFQFLQKFNGSKIIVGDFNLPGVNWELFALEPSNKYVTSVLAAMSSDGFSQLVASPTHRQGNILDLVLSNDHSIVSDVNVVENFSTSHHFAINFSVNYNQKAEIANARYNFKRTNYNILAQKLLAVDFEQVFATCSTVNQFCDGFYEVLQELIKCYVPLVKPGRQQKLLTKDIKRACASKRSAFIQLRRNPTSANKLRLRQASRNLRNMAVSGRRFKESRFLQYSSPSKFWGSVRSKMGNNNRIPTLCHKECDVSADGDKSQLFSEFFSNVFIQDDGKLPVFAPYRTLSKTKHSVLHFANLISSEFVYDILIRLPNKHSTGPDGIPAYFYKRLAPVLAAPLAKIFRVSLVTCQIPSIWLKAMLFLLFKLKGKPSEISNYRTISLLCEAFKVFERVMLRFLHSINVDSLIQPEQHGFRKKI